MPKIKVKYNIAYTINAFGFQTYDTGHDVMLNISLLIMVLAIIFFPLLCIL